MKVTEQWAMNMNKLVESDKKAKAKGQLVGRFIREQIADGYAYYKIVKVLNKKVHIERVTGIGDDWSVPYWGNKAVIDREYAENNIFRRDTMDKIFSKKGA